MFIVPLPYVIACFYCLNCDPLWTVFASMLEVMSHIFWALHFPGRRRCFASVRVVSVNGGWSQWGEWSDCSTTCDLGVKSRQRTCTDPVPQENGQPCNGSDEDAAECMLSYCPGKTISYNRLYSSRLESDL